MDHSFFGLQVFVGDVDQAFESCSGENVGIAWSIIASQFLAKTGQTIVQIKRGRKFQSKIGSQGWSRGWWALSLQVLGAALQAAANGTYGSIAGIVAELRGMSIGGAMSSAAVSVRFAAEELSGFASSWAKQHEVSSTLNESVLNWIRYVDDVLCTSYQVCSGCLGRFVSSMYSEPSSPVFSSGASALTSFTWLCCDFSVLGLNFLGH